MSTHTHNTAVEVKIFSQHSIKCSENLSNFLPQNSYGMHIHDRFSPGSCAPGKVSNNSVMADRPCRRSNTDRLSISTQWPLGDEGSTFFTLSATLVIMLAVDN